MLHTRCCSLNLTFVWVPDVTVGDLEGWVQDHMKERFPQELHFQSYPQGDRKRLTPEQVCIAGCLHFLLVPVTFLLQSLTTSHSCLELSLSVPGIAAICPGLFRGCHCVLQMSILPDSEHSQVVSPDMKLLLLERSILLDGKCPPRLYETGAREVQAIPAPMAARQEVCVLWPTEPSVDGLHVSSCWFLRFKMEQVHLCTLPGHERLQF